MTVVHSNSGARGDLFDENYFPPKRIRWARWFDLETGEYEAFRIDPKICKRLGVKLLTMVYRGKGRLKFIQTGIAKQERPAQTAMMPGKGIPSFSLRKGRRCVIDPTRKCEHKSGMGWPDCDKPAEWVTGDDKLLDPLQVGQRTYETGEIIQEHYWCSKHYQEPRQVFPDGSSDPIDVQCGRPE
jgi:hypothetical protein